MHKQSVIWGHSLLCAIINSFIFLLITFFASSIFSSADEGYEFFAIPLVALGSFAASLVIGEVSFLIQSHRQSPNYKVARALIYSPVVIMFVWFILASN